ncbi:MAG: polyprenyl synthetase family protein [Flavobacteriaceae bacterium]|nr:polyprenyl synthetase family protein [Flavobacteriaceae bacterium]
MAVITSYQTTFLDYLSLQFKEEKPAGLYNPMRYILELGGKRIRPVLALIAADAVGGDIKKALPAALAVEVFHNFSLVHDDIMDEAPLRRGKATVHEKWDANTGILSGDVMLVKAYQCLDAYPAELFKELTKLFSQTAKEVCEGQQYDMDFPQQDNVSQAEYLQMIKNKTAVLLGCSLQMGAMIGGLSREESQPFYDFGIELGLAFQLQDDYLDAFGDPLTFGKQVGGDIIENKKTLLYLLALDKGDKVQQAELEELFSSQPQDPRDKIATVKTLFKATKADLAIQQLMAQYTDKALLEVEKFAVSKKKKDLFKQFAKALMERKL